VTTTDRPVSHSPAQGLPTRLSRRQLLSRTAGLSATALMSTSLGGLLAACSSQNQTQNAGGGGTSFRRTGTLQAALTGEPDSLDPATSTIYTGAQVYDNIFNKLIDIDTDGTYYGQLATKWDAPDDRTWVLDLVDGATFHNGEKFTAEDVKYTFERILKPKTASSYAPLYDVIDNIEVATPTQVVFHLSKPFGPFLNNLANNGEIVNRKAVESQDPARKPVGTGPFRFVEWVQGDHVTLERFDDYWKEDRPYLDGIEFKFLLVDQGRIDSLRSGELDWVDAVPLQSLSTLKSDPSFSYVTARNAGIPDYLAMNTRKAPFSDKRVRQAVSMGIDREQIRAVAYSGAGEVGIEEVPTGSVWYDGLQPITRDVDGAKKLLADAGHGGGLTVEYLGLPQYPELLKTGQVVREQLADIGITMNIKQVDVSVWFNNFAGGTYEITSAYQERTIDPDNFYALVLRTGGVINTTGYSNPDVDAQIDKARTETKQSTRKKMYADLRRKIIDDAPLCFVHYETINYLMNKDVSGSSVNPTLELRMENVGFVK
jgi:peptide/nickel transport system substrate-binding protein